MNREDLISTIAEKAEITKKAADCVLDAIISGITDALAKGDKVTLVGFGAFQVNDRKQRQGINPQTKKKITIPARKAPGFKAGKKLKEAVK